MKKRIQLVWLIGSAMLLTACGSAPTTQRPRPIDTPAIEALTSFEAIEAELKQLRNLVEELQFESENAKQREYDLYADLDQRLANVERNQRGEDVLPAKTDEVVTEESPADDPEVAVVENTGEEADQNEAQSPQNEVVNTGDSSTVTLQEQETYDAAFELLKQSRYQEAIEQFRLVTENWPQGNLVDDAYYWMAEAWYVNREFQLALNGFRTVVDRYPDSEKVPEAQLKVGYIQYDIGAYKDAAQTFRDILVKFPGHQVTVSAQTRLRRIEQTIQ